ncbi:MAG: CopD family protein [Enterobacterales bacterium]|nr:CopD family protein [Enterobacterales bacterium]
MTYLWLKALHIIFMTSWFAGLFYLPRIFVNLAMAESEESYQHLLKMAQKLYRFVTPFMWITIILGSWMLYLNSGYLSQIWFQVKLLLVSSLVVYHYSCAYYLKRFSEKKSEHQHVFYRWYNEFPVLILFAVVVLVVVKPF